MTRTDRIRLVLSSVLMLQLWPWRYLTSDPGALIWAATAIIVIAAAGKASEILGLHRVATSVAQTVFALATVLLSLGINVGWDRALDPGGLADDVIRAVSSTAPLPPGLGATFIVVGTMAAIALLGDVVVAGAGHVWLSPLPVFGPYVVLGIALTTSVEFSEFALPALGVLLILVVSGAMGSVARIGRRLVTAGLVGALALGVTWLVVDRIPPLTPPTPRAPVQMNDPSLDLKRNLVRGGTDVILTYTTDQESPIRLKMATLPRFTANGFGLQNVRLSGNRLPRPPGLDHPGVDRTTSVVSSGFSSEWLPVPYAPRAVEAEGRWGHTLDSLDILSLADRGRTTATLGLSYTVESTDIAPSSEEVAAASTSTLDGREELVALPDGLDPDITALADEITAGTTTAGAAAQAIEAYLSSDLFTYDLTVRLDGDSLETLDDFLFSSRRGYCEQFAGAMAVLARAKGIPSRVAVGFTPGTHQDDGTWTVTPRDMHAWPELWLDGWGWVGFEPTPSAGSAPTDAGSPGSDASPTPGASAAPTESATPSPTPTPTPTAAPLQPGGDIEAAPRIRGWAIVAILMLAGVVLGTWGVPRAARHLRRRSRLRGTGEPRADALALWAEVRESYQDAGIVWPPGSPRYAAAEVRRALPTEETRESLDRLALRAERAAFDQRDLPPDASSPDDARAVIAALAERRRASAGPRRAQR